MKVRNNKFGYFLLILIAGCCFASDPSIPEIETPAGYDNLKIENCNFDGSSYLMNLSYNLRRIDSIELLTDVILINDTSETLYKLSKHLIDSSKLGSKTFVFCELGSVNEVVRAAMTYKVFINHTKKHVLVRSDVLGTGSCSGSDLNGFRWYGAFYIPKLPKGYEVVVNTNVSTKWR